jgi:outer membrane protein
MKKLVLLAVLALGIFTAQAQTASLKIGYADPDYILSEMPKAKQVDAELKSTQAQYKKEIDGKVQEFQTKLKAYNENINNMLPAVRENTERELQQLQANLEKLQQDAQNSLQKKQTDLMQPLITEIGKAIEAFAKENGYHLILTGQVGGLDVVLYSDESLQVSDLILKKMGITPKPANTTTTPNNQPKQ